jgi:hypothetical protein
MHEYESLILMDPETNYKSSMLEKTITSPAREGPSMLEASVTELIVQSKTFDSVNE